MVCLAHLTVLAALSVGAPPKLAVAGLKAQTDFAKKLERSVNEGDTKSLKHLFDKDALSNRIFKGLSAPASFREGAESRIDEFGDLFFAELVKKAPVHGYGMKLLRVHVVGGEPRAFFRVIGAGGGINYLDLLLTSPEKGKPVRIADAYVALSGEFLSQTIAVLMAKGLAILQQNEGDARATVKEFEAVARVTSLARSGKTKEALAAYENLSAEYKQEKAIMLIHVVLTSSLLDEDPDAYERSIDAFVKKFPSDPAAELVSLSGYALKMKYAEFRKALERLDKSVGGDPYLHVLRGGSFRMEGKFKEAKVAVGRAIAADPDLTPAYIALAEIALKEKEFKELARLLTVMETRFGMDFSPAATAAAYAEFRESPAYTAWWEARKNK